MKIRYVVFVLKQEGQEFHEYWTLGEWMKSCDTEKEAEYYIELTSKRLQRLYTIVKIYYQE